MQWTILQGLMHPSGFYLEFFIHGDLGVSPHRDDDDDDEDDGECMCNIIKNMQQ